MNNEQLFITVEGWVWGELYNSCLAAYIVVCGKSHSGKLSTFSETTTTTYNKRIEDVDCSVVGYRVQIKLVDVRCCSSAALSKSWAEVIWWYGGAIDWRRKTSSI